MWKALLARVLTGTRAPQDAFMELNGLALSPGVRQAWLLSSPVRRTLRALSLGPMSLR
jgi:hypothetical protein